MHSAGFPIFSGICTSFSMKPVKGITINYNLLFCYLYQRKPKCNKLKCSIFLRYNDKKKVVCVCNEISIERISQHSVLDIRKKLPCNFVTSKIMDETEVTVRGVGTGFKHSAIQTPCDFIVYAVSMPLCIKHLAGLANSPGNYLLFCLRAI